MTRTSGRQRCSRWIVAGLVIAGLCLAAPGSARAITKRQPKKEGPPPCVEGDRACAVDRAIEEVGKTAGGMTQAYEEGRFWDLPPDLFPSVTSKHRVLRSVVLAPTYAARALTFPVALLGDFLIRKGVVHAVVDALSNDARTFWVYPRLELGFGSGFGGGVGLTHLDLFEEGYRVDAGYLVHVNLDQSGWVTLRKPDAFSVGGIPINYTIGMNVGHDKNANFYGIGNYSSDADASQYKVDNSSFGGEFAFELTPHVGVGLHCIIEGDATRPGEGSKPSVETIFPASSLPGFDTELLYANVGFEIQHDTREAGAAPERGGLQRFWFSRYQGLWNTGFDYNQYGIEILQLFRLWLPRNVLALRMGWTYQQQTGSDQIPFDRLATLDVNSPERGLPSGRFRDRGRMVFNVEYRYPVWRYVDGSFFFDTGRVFHDIDAMPLNHFKYAGGFGLRFRTSDYFLFRVEVAIGSEGTRALFKTSTAF